MIEIKHSIWWIVFLNVATIAFSTSVQSSARLNFTSCQLREILGLPKCSDNITTPPLSAYELCPVDEIYLNVLKESLTCDDTRRYYPACRQNFTFAYQEVPPYVYRDKNGDITGLLISILKEVLVDRCCMGCNGLTIRTVRTLEEEILAQVNNDTAPDMILPIYSDTLPAITLQYLPITSIKISALIGKIAQVKTEHLMTTLVYSAFKTWPLFLMAICMAICAGTFMWILDTWRNKGHFPRQFPSGPFEGFWWAYVSMTTVGYGDRTPSTPLARGFAVIWILMGVTVFNMFTASLTSVLSTTFNNKSYSVVGKHVGVLKFGTGYRIAKTEYANPVEYETMEELRDALLDEKISGVALEKQVAVTFLARFKQELQGYQIQKEITDDTNPTIGGVIVNPDIKQMLYSYLKKRYVAELKSYSLFHLADIEESPTLQFKDTHKVISHEHIAFILTVSISILLTFVCIIFGIVLSMQLKKRKTHKLSTKINGHNTKETET